MFPKSNGHQYTHVEITHEFILSRITEESIFHYYTGEIVQYDTLICSPLREDKNPTCGFLDKGTHILFTDFSGDFGGNCFNLVARMFSISYSDALTKVAMDFGLIKKGFDGTFEKVEEIKPILQIKKEPKVKAKKKIQIKRRVWDKKDAEFWTSFGISRKELDKYQVSPCEIIWLDDRIIYQYKITNPAYAYYLGKGDYKIYFPLAKEKRYKFLTNNSKIQGYTELEFTSDLLIITKALKDVMVFKALGYEAIAPPAEGVLLDEKVMNKLKTKYKKIVLFYDNDEAGRLGAERNAKEYNLPTVFLPLGTTKDISDYRKEHSKEETIKIIKELLNKIVWQQQQS